MDPSIDVKKVKSIKKENLILDIRAKWRSEPDDKYKKIIFLALRKPEVDNYVIPTSVLKEMNQTETKGSRSSNKHEGWAKLIIEATKVHKRKLASEKLKTIRYTNYEDALDFKYEELAQAPKGFPKRVDSKNIPKAILNKRPSFDPNHIFIPYWDANKQDNVYTFGNTKPLERKAYSISWKTRWMHDDEKQYRYANNSIILQPDAKYDNNKFVWDTKHVITVPTILKKIRDIWSWDNESKNITDIFDISIRPLDKIRLRDVKMFGSELGYIFSPKIDHIAQLGEQKCTPQLLFLALSPHIKNITQERIEKEFAGMGIDVKKGISPAQVVEWKNGGHKHRHDQYKRISLYILDPSLKVFIREPADRSVGHAIVICFVVNNGHCYGIFDEGLKKSIIDNHEIRLNTFQIKLDYNRAAILKLPEFFVESDLDRLELKQPKQKELILLVHYPDLTQFANYISKITKTCITPNSVNFVRGRLTMFMHPLTNQYFISSPNYDRIKSMCDELYAEKNYIGYEFVNQTYSMLANSIFEEKFCVLPKSVYPPEYLDILETNPIGPIFYKTADYHLIPESVISIDIIKNYTSCYLLNNSRFPVYQCTDKIVPRNNTHTGQFLQNSFIGEVYLSKGFTLCEFLTYGPNWYPSSCLPYLLDNKLIEMKDITHVLEASGYMEPKLLKDFVNYVMEKFPNDYKHLINHWNGDKGRFHTQTTVGFNTNSWETVMAFVNDYPNVTVDHFDDFFQVKQHVYTKQLEGHVAFYRHILMLSLITVDQMFDEVVTDPSHVFGITVDAIKLVNPKIKIESINGTRPGEYRLETDAINLRGYTLQEWPIRTAKIEPYRLTKNIIDPKNILNLLDLEYTKNENDTKDEKTKNLKSCIVHGPPGCGKSGLFIDYVKKNPHNLNLRFCSWTARVVVNNNKRAKQKICKTLDTLITDRIPLKEIVYRLSKVDALIIDEAFFTPSKYFKKLYMIKQRLPNLKFILIGDEKQCKPIDFGVEKNDQMQRIDYMTNPIIHYLTDGNICRMLYDPSTGRYDKETQLKLEEFDAKSKLNLLDKKLFEHPDMTICMSSAIRDQVNQEVFNSKIKAGNKLQTAKYTDESGNVYEYKYFIGCPVISHTNRYFEEEKNNVINGLDYTIKEFRQSHKDNDSIFVLEHDDGSEIRLKITEFVKLFRYFFCETIYRSIGLTLKKPYNIVETHKMSKEDFYTAISRTTEWKYIGLEEKHVNNKVFEPTQIIHVCLKITKKKLEIRQTIIYQYKNEELKQSYIGYTQQKLQDRNEQHHETPNCKKTKEFFDHKATDKKPAILKKVLATRKQAEDVETKEIHFACYNKEYELVNTMKMAKPINPIDVNTSFIKILKTIKEKVDSKFEIIDNIESSHYRIRYTDESGKKIDIRKKYGKRKTKEQVLIEMETTRHMLMMQNQVVTDTSVKVYSTLYEEIQNIMK
jgi:hypothetical protein